jgi:hypothetical protein
MKKHLIIAAALTVVSPLLASAPGYADTVFSFSFTDTTNTVTGRVDFTQTSGNNTGAHAVYIDSISPLSVSWPSSFPDNLLMDSQLGAPTANLFTWTTSGISSANFLVTGTGGLEFFLDTLSTPPQYIWMETTATGITSHTTANIFSPIPTATPLPAALPLFATGIGGLSLLGWRRKRKAQAVA